MKNNKANTDLILTKAQVDSVYALYSSGQIENAIIRIKELNEDYPNVPLLFNILGACYKSLGEFQGAAQMFETATKLKPDYAEAHFNYGVILKGLDQIDEAIKSYKRAISILPNYPDAHNNLGNAYKDLGNKDSAIESYEWALAYQPEYVQAMINIGNIYSDYDHNVAIEYYEKAITIDPNKSESHFALGSLLRYLGRKKDAIKSYENAIEINPNFIDAHKDLTTLKKYSKNDSQIKIMQSLLESKDLSEEESVGLNYSLAKVNSDLNNLDEQIKFLNEGNRLRKKQLNYSFDKDKKLFSEIRQVFKTPPPILKESSLDASLKRPIFIVGMPRSGTSLVEQILSSHQEVHGAGELEILTKLSYPVMQQYIINNESVLSEKVVSTIRQGYLDFLDTLEVSEKIITDKMPLNFRFIGFILSAFPEAKIVHMKRDSMATCWSIYQFYFRGSGNGFGYNLKDLASYYHLYLELMGFWRGLFPNQIYDMCYEDLTTNQEEETRNLLKYCELEWDKNCLNFQNNKRSVKTASTLQVREKMYQGSSKAWKKYEAYLKPLIKGLN